MRGFAFSLNVRRNYCHAQKKEGEKPGLDYASDEKDTKKTARAMLQMVAAINRDYISKVPQTPPSPQIEVPCVTCHHGLEQPRTLNSVLAEAIDQKGIDAGIALYGELRKKYYGGAQYDFGETSLNQLSESLLAQNKNREALAIDQLRRESSGFGVVLPHAGDGARSQRSNSRMPSPTTARCLSYIQTTTGPGSESKHFPKRIENGR